MLCRDLLSDQPRPSSLLASSNAMGNKDFQRCVVFHSLSKRSNLPGLRSGFVAGDANIIEQFLCYRTYHGCALGMHQQRASTLAWQDEVHVQENRALYEQKFRTVTKISRLTMTSVSQPVAFITGYQPPRTTSNSAKPCSPPSTSL